MKTRILHVFAGLSLAWCVLPLTSYAVILYRTGNATVNTAAPGDSRDDPWNSQGTWGSFLGTPISPNQFITAKHVGGSIGQTFTLNGSPYVTIAENEDPLSDLSIWTVSGSFSSWMEIYTASDEVGKDLFLVGRGTQRGEEVNVANASVADLRGWLWGTSDGVKRWGENTVEEIRSGGSGGEQLYATLDREGLSDEAHLSVGDSGGGAFINDNGTWKLAGIHYSVDGYYNYANDTATEFNAAIFDAGGLYVGNDGSGYNLVADRPFDRPGGFYTTRVSERKSWIFSIIPEPPTVALVVLGFGFIAWTIWKRKKIDQQEGQEGQNI
jgi:hypothetical protein